ncbi:MAG TPA: response regulator, partial [Planctomycetaceae bacterium]|nr:response regulator [Planctomycetaceae bacterium]
MGCKTASYREEPGAGKPHAGICEGGAGQPASLPRLSNSPATSHWSPLDSKSWIIKRGHQGRRAAGRGTLRVQSYIICLIMWGLLGGLISLWAIERINADTTRAQREASDAVLVQRDFGRFVDSFSQWLMVSDLVLGSDLTYLLQGAERLGREVDEQLQVVENSVFGMLNANSLKHVRTFIDAHNNRLNIVGNLRQDGRANSLDRLLSEMDQQSEIALEFLELSRVRLRTHVDGHLEAHLASEHHKRSRQQFIGGILLLMMIIAWRWTSKRISEPLVRLAKEASDAQTAVVDAQFTRTGPREVVELATSFSKLVNSLEVRVHERTLEAEAAGQIKAEFLANMSHEIRTPMTAIAGYAELIARPDQSPAKRDEWCGILRRNTDFLLNLINDIMDISKIEAGQLPITPTECDLAELIRDVTTSFSWMIREKLLELRVEIVTDLPERILVDAFRLRQVLVNLLSNGLKFTDEGGVTLQISATEPKRGSSSLAIAVSDTGIGIRPELLSNLFTKFTQVHDQRQQRYGGTGLGLNISKRITELLGGSIEVESEIGQGSTFTVSIPVGVPITSQQTSPVGVSKPRSDERCAATSLSGQHVLLVDDNPANRQIIRFFLEDFGATVTTANDGKEGMTAAVTAWDREQPFDAILMDMQMPVMNGYQAVKEIRAATVQTEIIALTAYAMAGDRQRCIDAGCDDYLTKPVLPADLLRVLASRNTNNVGMSTTKQPSEPIGKPSTIADNPAFADIQKSYCRRLAETAELLLASMNSGDTEAVENTVHRVKGTAGNYGFPEITEIAQTILALLHEGVELSVIKDNIESLTDSMMTASRSIAQ